MVASLAVFIHKTVYYILQNVKGVYPVVNNTIQVSLTNVMEQLDIDLQDGKSKLTKSKRATVW